MCHHENNKTNLLFRLDYVISTTNIQFRFSNITSFPNDATFPSSVCHQGSQTRPSLNIFTKPCPIIIFITLGITPPDFRLARWPKSRTNHTRAQERGVIYPLDEFWTPHQFSTVSSQHQSPIFNHVCHWLLHIHYFESTRWKRPLWIQSTK